jgi:sigma-B regulation protein RsbU (phosphoserine phosphatase)
VSGKGVPASLVMAVTRTLFRNISAHTAEPGQIAAALNNTLSEGNDTCMFVTLFVGILHLSDGTLSYCNAGHDKPILIGQEVRTLPCESNVPLGVSAGWTFTAQTAHITPQTTIFLYTDGLTEAEDASHAQFGITRVNQTAKMIAAHGDDQPQKHIESMASAVKDFVREAAQSDDLTMLALKYLKTNGQ